MSNEFKKITGGGKKPADTVAPQPPALPINGSIPKTPTEPEQTKEQVGAAAARKKRGGRVGQRGLLYASRLGGRGGARGDTQDTLGSA